MWQAILCVYRMDDTARSDLQGMRDGRAVQFVPGWGTRPVRARFTVTKTHHNVAASSWWPQGLWLTS
jgi:hypothetical protein